MPHRRFTVYHNTQTGIRLLCISRPPTAATVKRKETYYQITPRRAWIVDYIALHAPAAFYDFMEGSRHIHIDDYIFTSKR